MIFLKKLAPNFIKKSRIVNSVIEIKTTINNIKKLSLILSWHKLAQYKVLTDVASYDTPGKHLRFSIIYNLLSIQFNSRLRIYSQLDESIPIPTISTIFLSSASLEREAWDMFGLFFFNNKDLRRILSDYGFKNFPLRKDFPLKGFYELQYFDKEKRVSYISDQSSQQARIFSFKNPWFYEKKTLA